MKNSFLQSCSLNYLQSTKQDPVLSDAMYEQWFQSFILNHRLLLLEKLNCECELPIYIQKFIFKEVLLKHHYNPLASNMEIKMTGRIILLSTHENCLT